MSLVYCLCGVLHVLCVCVGFLLPPNSQIQHSPDHDGAFTETVWRNELISYRMLSTSWETFLCQPVMRYWCPYIIPNSLKQPIYSHNSQQYQWCQDDLFLTTDFAICCRLLVFVGFFLPFPFREVPALFHFWIYAFFLSPSAKNNSPPSIKNF